MLFSVMRPWHPVFPVPQRLARFSGTSSPKFGEPRPSTWWAFAAGAPQIAHRGFRSRDFFPAFRSSVRAVFFGPRGFTFASGPLNVLAILDRAAVERQPLIGDSRFGHVDHRLAFDRGLVELR